MTIYFRVKSNSYTQKQWRAVRITEIRPYTALTNDGIQDWSGGYGVSLLPRNPFPGLECRHIWLEKNDQHYPFQNNRFVPSKVTVNTTITGTNARGDPTWKDEIDPLRMLTYASRTRKNQALKTHGRQHVRNIDM